MKNKRTAIFYFSLFCCVLILLLTFSCQKKSEPGATAEKTITPIHPYFNKAVGGPIDRATARRYKQNLLTKYKGVAAVPAVYYLRASVLQKLIDQEKTVGICFYFGQDNSGQIRLMPIGVDVHGAVMPVPTVTTTDSVVSWAEAKVWSRQFKRAYLGNVWAHFWGSTAVEWLLAQGTEWVRIDLGFTDEGAQQMIFSNAALEDPESADMTRTCPPYCPSGFDNLN